MISADKVTPEAINFMATHGHGLICLPITGHHLDDLKIPVMVSDNSNTSQYGTPFCVSIKARRNVSPGISASHRAQTILTTFDPQSKPAFFLRLRHPPRSTLFPYTTLFR